MIQPYNYVFAIIQFPVTFRPVMTKLEITQLEGFVIMEKKPNITNPEKVGGLEKPKPFTLSE